ncbi:MAG: hypothetical protein ACHP83_09080 [Burkholderiales bacterium]
MSVALLRCAWSLCELPALQRGKAAGGYAPALECGSYSPREGFPAVLGLMARRGRRTPTRAFAGTTEVFVDENHERCCAVGGARRGRLVGRREAQQRGRRARSARFVN